MDNGQVIVVSEGREQFDLALKLAFGDRTATGFMVQEKPEFDQAKIYTHGNEHHVMEPMFPPPTRLFETRHPRLIFFWWAPDRADYHKLMFPMKAEQVADQAWSWLNAQDYGKEPDHDGSNGKGFAVYNESWGHVGNFYQAICAVSPQWAWYGK